MALVDDEDFEYLSQFNWHFNGGYAVRTVGSKCYKIYLHNQLMKPPKGFEVDHINLDKLDNRRMNLRIVTKAQNQQNRASFLGSSSKFRGVTFHKGTGEWQAQIRKDGVIKYLGLYVTQEEAALIYNQKSIELFGEYGRLNQV